MHEPQVNGAEIATTRFRIQIYLRIMANRTLRPVKRKEAATFVIGLLCEYPTYEEELEIKRNSTTYDEYRGVHHIDTDAIAAWRVKRCLVRWNLHLKLRNFSTRLHRTGKYLREDSWAEFRKLPPLIRKEIIQKMWTSLGPP